MLCLYRFRSQFSVVGGILFTFGGRVCMMTGNELEMSNSVCEDVPQGLKRMWPSM